MKILVPIDGSKYSMEGVKVAGEIAKGKKAEVQVMTVTPYLAGLDLELSAKEADSVNESMKRRGEEVLEKAQAKRCLKGCQPRPVLCLCGQMKVR